MSEVATKVIVDCSTGESSIVPLTEAELEQRELDRISFETAEAERLAAEEALATLKASAKAKLIAGEPMTEAEASVLLG
jgi:glyoxylate carboligase